MLPTPVGLPIDFDLVDGNVLFHITLGQNRNGQPDRAVFGLNTISVTPTVLVVLDLIEKNKYIGFLDLVKVPPPGDVGGLDDGAVQERGSSIRGR